MLGSETKFYYQLELQYVGTRYCGWQIQDNVSTVQGELNKVLKELSKSDDIKSVGSGRTDTGVHAFSQIVKVTLPLNIPVSGLIKGINSLLPHDIKVISGKESTFEFHPTFQCVEKEYNYFFTLNEVSPFAAPFVVPFLYPVDMVKINEACKLFEGVHDFQNFYCVGTVVESTERQIFHCSITKHQNGGPMGVFCPEYYVLKIVGNGFLKQMVRSIMGAIWSVGRGRNTLAELKDALDGPKSPKRIGAVAPPQGLYLTRAKY